jgi:hypothetical protein
MKTAARLTIAERDRALGRLRALTVGTTLASLTALGGFSIVAAATNPGSTGGQTAVAGESAISGTLTTDATTSARSTTTSTTTTTTGSTATPAPSLQPAATSAATTSRSAQVTTGGS